MSQDIKPVSDSLLCHICGELLSPKDSIYSHLLTHENVKSYKCDSCNYSTKSKTNLQTHLLVHSDTKNHECNFCHKLFKRQDKLYDHIRTHTKEKPLSCKAELCNYSCSDYTVMKRHVEATHLGLAGCDKNYTCPVCGFSVRVSRDLKSHMRTHSGEKLWACHLCSFETGFSGALQRHVRTHTGDKPYACLQCPYKSATSSHLKRHQKNHLQSSGASKQQNSKGRKRKNVRRAKQQKQKCNPLITDATTN